MMILEIIELRTAERNQVIRLLEKEQIITQNSDITIKLFIHKSVTSDLSIHISYDQQSIQKEVYQMCIQIKSLLSRWGLIHYSIWQEVINSGGTNE